MLILQTGHARVCVPNAFDPFGNFSAFSIPDIELPQAAVCTLKSKCDMIKRIEKMKFPHFKIGKEL